VSLLKMGSYLDGASSDVTVMGQSSGEGGTVVEGEGRLALGELELFVEGVDFLPVGEDFFFLLGEVWPFRHYNNKARSDIVRDGRSTYRWRILNSCGSL